LSGTNLNASHSIFSVPFKTSSKFLPLITFLIRDQRRSVFLSLIYWSIKIIHHILKTFSFRVVAFTEFFICVSLVWSGGRNISFGSKNGSLAKFFCLGRNCSQSDNSLTPQGLLLALPSCSHENQKSSNNPAECRVEELCISSFHKCVKRYLWYVYNWAEVSYCHTILSCAQRANRDYDKSFPLWRRIAALRKFHESVSSYQSSDLRSWTSALISASALLQSRWAKKMYTEISF
jgi:hypothetical protein